MVCSFKYKGNFTFFIINSIDFSAKKTKFSLKAKESEENNIESNFD
jgi:hypothetical protein